MLNMGLSYVMAGQNQRAEEVSQRLLASDPLGPNTHLLLGVRHWFVGRPEEAPPHLRRGLDLDPQNRILRWCAGYTEALLGDVLGAAVHAAWLRENAPNLPYTVQLCSLLEALEGRSDEARELLEKLEVSPLDAHNTFHLAESFAMAGETDRALDLLERAVDVGFYPYPFLAEYCPFMAPLRGTEAFEKILAAAFDRFDSFFEA